MNSEPVFLAEELLGSQFHINSTPLDLERAYISAAFLTKRDLWSELYPRTV